jgi:excisionase family DNA binding protein
MPDFQRIDPTANYTSAEAAALIGLSVTTVSQAATAGRLAATLTGAGYLIQGRDLLAWRSAVRARNFRSLRKTRTELPIDPNATYTPTAAAQAKNVPRRLLMIALNAGQLPARKKRGRWAIQGADLLAWTPQRQELPFATDKMSLSQAASEAGLQQQGSVLRAIQAGRLRASVVDGRWVIDADDLAAWRRGLKGAPIEDAIDPRELYRVADAAKVLGVSRQGLYLAATEGRIKLVETPFGYRVRGADLLAWRGNDRTAEGKRKR